MPTVRPKETQQAVATAPPGVGAPDTNQDFGSNAANAAAAKAKAVGGSKDPKNKVSLSKTSGGGGGGGNAAVQKQKESLSRMQPAGPNATAIHDGWGVCDTETVTPGLKLKEESDKFVVSEVDFDATYSKIVTLIGGVTEIGGPGVDTTAENYTKQMGDLRYVADDYKGDDPGGATAWYALQAVEDHETIHENRLKPALVEVAPVMAAEFTSLSVSNEGIDEAVALAQIKALPAYATAVAGLRDTWDAKYVQLITGDHTALTPAAEHAVVDPLIASIDNWAKTEGPEAPSDEGGMCLPEGTSGA